MDTKKIAASLHIYERKVLPVLKKSKSLQEITAASGLKEVEAMRALQWLKNKKLISLKREEKELINLDVNGEEYLKEKLPEKRFLEAAENNKTISEIKEAASLSDEEVNVCLGLLRKKAAINIRKEEGLVIELTQNGKGLIGKESFEEQFLKKDFPVDLNSLNGEEKFAFSELKQRKAIIRVDKVRTSVAELTALGKKVLASGIKEEEVTDRLTPEMLKTGTWKTKKFRAYDIKSDVSGISGGRRHFVNQAADYMKRVWLDLGFKEMKGGFVQTAFWDLDALFVPQDHPARDMQDTLYVKEPRTGKLPKEMFSKVKATHEDGWTTGSKGWRYEFSEELAKQNLLRTHTTVLSAKAIANLKKEDLPAKFFSVNKVFRNETLSWKALFEFVQVEGIVADMDGNFKNLKGYLSEFFKKLGFDKIRIRPAYFPYTEPSAEIEVYVPEKKTWMEVGGSGIFRPEVTKPLIGFEVPVLAWGLGMERSIMQYYKIKDIRELYKNDLKQLREIKLWMK